MATEVGQAYVTLIPSAKGFAGKMQSEIGGDVGKAGTTGGKAYGSEFSKSASSGIKSKASSLFSGLKSIAAPVALAGAGLAVAGFLKDSIAEAREAAVVSARTASVIKSMGNASKISADQVADLAGQLSLKSGIDDEAIQSGENLILTFGNIRNEAGAGNDIFNQTTGLMVDMSKAMGTDMKGSAIQLGKALNDPTKGVSALSRVGVAFTAQQKEQIKTLQDSGDMLGAQKIIMGEVKKEFGGAAEAMATPAEKASVAWGNFKETVGTALLPVLDKLLGWFTIAVTYAMTFFNSFSSGGVKLGQTGAQINQVLEQIKATFANVVAIVTILWATFGDRLIAYAQTAFANIKQIIGGAMTVIEGIVKLVLAVLQGDWSGAWAAIKEILRGAVQVILGVIKQALNNWRLLFSVAMTVIRAILTAAWNGFKALVALGVAALVSLVRSLPGRARDALSALPGVLRAVLSAAFSAARAIVSAGANWIVDQVRAIPGRLRGLAGSFGSAGKAIIGAFVNGLKNAGGVVEGIASSVWGAVRSMLNSAIGQINSALNFTIGIPGPDIHVNAGRIPYLASGARATGGTLAVIGEGKEAETVLPDSLLRGLLENVHAAGASAASAFHLYDVDNVLLGTIHGVADQRIGATQRRSALAVRGGRQQR